MSVSIKLGSEEFKPDKVEGRHEDTGAGARTAQEYRNHTYMICLILFGYL